MDKQFYKAEAESCSGYIFNPQHVSAVDLSLIQRYQKMFSGDSIQYWTDDCLLKKGLIQQLQANQIAYDANQEGRKLQIEVAEVFPTKQSLVFRVRYGPFSQYLTMLIINQSYESPGIFLNLERKYAAQTEERSSSEEKSGAIRYSSHLPSQQIALKAYVIKNPMDIDEVHQTMGKAIKELFLLKIASCLKTGPCVRNYLGFDLLLYRDCMEFAMERCIEGRQGLKRDLSKALIINHLFKLMHLDVKPDNVGYSPKYQRHVFLDFGLSQLISQPLGCRTYVRFIGSYFFASPEMKQTFSGRVRQVDLYYNDTFGLNRLLEQMQKEPPKPITELTNSQHTINLQFLLYQCKFLRYYDNPTHKQITLREKVMFGATNITDNSYYFQKHPNHTLYKDWQLIINILNECGANNERKDYGYFQQKIKQITHFTSGKKILLAVAEQFGSKIQKQVSLERLSQMLDLTSQVVGWQQKVQASKEWLSCLEGSKRQEQPVENGNGKEETTAKITSDELCITRSFKQLYRLCKPMSPSPSSSTDQSLQARGTVLLSILPSMVILEVLGQEQLVQCLEEQLNSEKHCIQRQLHLYSCFFASIEWIRAKISTRYQSQQLYDLLLKKLEQTLSYQPSTQQDRVALDLLQDLMFVRRSLMKLSPLEMIEWHQKTIKGIRYGAVRAVADTLNLKAAFQILHYINYSVWSALVGLRHIQDYQELHREILSFDPQCNIPLNLDKASPQYTHIPLFAFFYDQKGKDNFAVLCRNILYHAFKNLCCCQYFLPIARIELTYAAETFLRSSKGIADFEEYLRHALNVIERASEPQAKIQLYKHLINELQIIFKPRSFFREARASQILYFECVRTIKEYLGAQGQQVGQQIIMAYLNTFLEIVCRIPYSFSAQIYSQMTRVHTKVSYLQDLIKLMQSLPALYCKRFLPKDIAQTMLDLASVVPISQEQQYQAIPMLEAMISIVGFLCEDPREISQAIDRIKELALNHKCQKQVVRLILLNFTAKITRFQQKPAMINRLVKKLQTEARKGQLLQWIGAIFQLIRETLDFGLADKMAVELTERYLKNIEHTQLIGYLKIFYQLYGFYMKSKDVANLLGLLSTFCLHFKGSHAQLLCILEQSEQEVIALGVSPESYQEVQLKVGNKLMDLMQNFYKKGPLELQRMLLCVDYFLKSLWRFQKKIVVENHGLSKINPGYKCDARALELKLNETMKAISKQPALRDFCQNFSEISAQLSLYVMHPDINLEKAPAVQFLNLSQSQKEHIESEQSVTLQQSSIKNITFQPCI